MLLDFLRVVAPVIMEEITEPGECLVTITIPRAVAEAKGIEGFSGDDFSALSISAEGKKVDFVGQPCAVEVTDEGDILVELDLRAVKS